MDKKEFATAICNVILAVCAFVSCGIAIWLANVQANQNHAVLEHMMAERQDSISRQTQERQRDERDREHMRAERQEWSLERKQDRDSERKKRAPFLAILDCCNPSPIWAEFRPATNDKRISLRAAPGAKIDINETEESGIIAKVTNVGGGAALECRVVWRIEEGETDEGLMTEAELNIQPTSNYYLWPKVIYPGKSATIRTLPGCIERDGACRVKHIAGQLDILCKDLAGFEHAFSQSFTIDPYYDPLKPGFSIKEDRYLNQPLLGAHFVQGSKFDGPFPHSLPSFNSQD